MVEADDFTLKLLIVYSPMSRQKVNDFLDCKHPQVSEDLWEEDSTYHYVGSNTVRLNSSPKTSTHLSLITAIVMYNFMS